MYTMLVGGARRAVRLRAACGVISCAMRLDMILQAGIVDFAWSGVKASDDEIEQQT